MFRCIGRGVSKFKKKGEDKTVQLNAAIADLNTTLSSNKHLQDELSQLKGVLNQTEIQLRDQQIYRR